MSGFLDKAKGMMGKATGERTSPTNPSIRPTPPVLTSSVPRCRRLIKRQQIQHDRHLEHEQVHQPRRGHGDG